MATLPCLQSKQPVQVEWSADQEPDFWIDIFWDLSQDLAGGVTLRTKAEKSRCWELHGFFFHAFADHCPALVYSVQNQSVNPHPSSSPVKHQGHLCLLASRQKTSGTRPRRQSFKTCRLRQETTGEAKGLETKDCNLTPEAQVSYFNQSAPA